ncbi:hypothetical protein WR164_13370 [Philodulcilactobacillus myokoensis]|uniref:SAM-dependent methyltransferase n=1 Tax=Philodulcilactobacillus myokoensis TaxID=2929573 RepID=A0A9W6B2B4_9LACO|nr:SAM-dependent methyltransferase [Philodulcilactobacillus myokoensis]GLB47358.1 hypothetical protein WR164_13370 [Philodulcilactobacillus myokoensis]
MNKKKLLKRMKHQHKIKREIPYMDQIKKYYHMFDHIPEIKFILNNILESNRLLSNKILPQDLPELLLPDNIQQIVIKQLNQHYAQNDQKGDQHWNELSKALPKLDKLVRNFRDYLEQEYGMWAYISAPFAKDLAEYCGRGPVLEVMAGNGYISKGLRDNGTKVFSTDSLAWTKENETGKHLVTKVEKLSAIDAFNKYKDQIKDVIMCWSPDGVEDDWQLLQAIRKSKLNLPLITIGEKNGATDSKVFWQNAKFIKQEDAKHLNRHHQPFDLIHDQVYIIK